MSASDRHPIRLHEDQALFREAVRFTAAETGFVARLIEKDYFCTVLLEHLAGVARELVFKGGTCLSKVHTNFYRLSEDLDFVIPTSFDATRSDRTRSAKALKEAVLSIEASVPGTRVAQPITGANNSTQYDAVIGYASLLGTRNETIEIEVSLREPLWTPLQRGRALVVGNELRSRIARPFCRRLGARQSFFGSSFSWCTSSKSLRSVPSSDQARVCGVPSSSTSEWPICDPHWMPARSS